MMQVWNRENVLYFPSKELRSRVIAQHVRDSGYRGAVIFSCGNAADALRRQLQGAATSNNLVNQPVLVEVSPRGPLGANRWWTPEEIHQSWPDLFDATTGHLPAPMMVAIAHEYRYFLRSSTSRYPFLNGKDVERDGPWFVPTGSGETIVCLKMAFPKVDFCAVYDNKKPATARDDKAPLNAIVDALFPVEHWDGLL